MPDTAQPQLDQTLVGLSFEDGFRATEFLTATARLAASGYLRIIDAVIVTKDEQGKTTVRETTDLQIGESALSGALWAGLFGVVLGGPVGWLAGMAVGAGAGALTAKVVDLGLSDEWVDWFREVVQPNTTTVALLATDIDNNALVAEAERFSGARLVYTNLPPATLDRVKQALNDNSASD
ncbi:MAG: DUF1269 domain-containing protein [Microthrixaceae bacterium]|nr:DUF1269 domain-containing protein [Microthrixaceae bacterium]MCO5311703.1 DUF1269 domain-containing protein [Microthrixaceae bacterium]HPB44267.1 DUF1269 domain-containing protein [Microthrixaceae bacterium]